MTIEIQSETNQSRGYKVYANGKVLSNPKGGMFPQDWSEDEIQSLLGDKYQSFEQGRFLFNNFPVWKINLLQLKQAATTREQLLFISQFID